MIVSPLIEPLVKPLLSRRAAGSRRRTALNGSALAATALCLTALVGVTTNAQASADTSEEVAVQRNAHRAPKATPAKIVWAELFALQARRDDELTAPTESADFEHDAVTASRLRHCLARGPDGPGLVQGRRLDLVLGAFDRTTFLLFGSSRPQSAIPAS
jgi:hypothetical protein